jgi:hypothetical protein
MLTCASQLMLAGPSSSGSTNAENVCEQLVSAAEASAPIRVLYQLFTHDALGDKERRRRCSGTIVFVLGSWCQAFRLRITTMPYDTLQDLLYALECVFKDNTQLVRWAFFGCKLLRSSRAHGRIHHSDIFPL